VPDFLVNYIDYDKFARDLELNGELIEIEHEVFVTNPQEL